MLIYFQLKLDTHDMKNCSQFHGNFMDCTTKDKVCASSAQFYCALQ
jgi:hypothetical protein